MARPLGCDNIEDSRGVAVADLNSDGRLDLIVGNNADPPVVFINRVREVGDWLRITLYDPSTGNSDAIGGRVELTLDESPSTRTLTRYVQSGAGFASQSELALHFGLGQSPTIAGIRVVWPDGKRESISVSQLAGAVNRNIRITRGNPEPKIAEPNMAIAVGSTETVDGREEVTQ